eukprot:Opistho-2@4631
MTNDVEMKDADQAKAATETEAPVVKDPNVLAIADIRNNITLIEKGVAIKETRYATRVLRTTVSLRRKLNPTVLRAAISAHFPIAASESKTELLKYVDALGPVAMEVDAGPGVPATPSAKDDAKKKVVTAVLPEVDVYIHLLVLVALLDAKKNGDALDCANAIARKVQGQNRRTLDHVAARAYFYYARAYEVNGQLGEIRNTLHATLRTATLQHDEATQASVINLLLRYYTEHSLYDQADKLVSKSTFPESANNNEWARYLYYLGRIKAIQLDYSESQKNLQQAIRKAPQTSAVGFQQTANKLAIIVQLLLGEIPERSLFRQKTLSTALKPYFQLTQAVRVGDLATFSHVVEKHADAFRADKNLTLIHRLRHNVIKTGVRMINLSYSRISLVDIAKKLQLDSPEDAEYIVAKAIRDGVIEATIDHEQGFVQSKENVDIYTSTEPQAAFHQRITFCINIHNESVKALRFPPNAHRKDIETDEERREREREESELAKEIADEEDDF